MYEKPQNRMKRDLRIGLIIIPILLLATWINENWEQIIFWVNNLLP